MKSQTLDNFEDLSGWTTLASGQAQMDISREAGPGGTTAMRLDFDFQGSGGFVVARKAFTLPLPEAYAFTVMLRGEAPRNKFEFKLVDPSSHNVWRYQEEAFDFAADWQPLKIRSSQIDFAWGPAGGGVMSQVGAIELVIAAGPGGKGSVWIADLGFEDHSFTATPKVQASSALPDNEPRCAVDGFKATHWLSAPDDATPWLLLDFQEDREFGGLVIQWAATAQAFQVEISSDSLIWSTLHRAEQAAGERSYVYLPQCSARYVRLRTAAGIVDIAVKPYDFSRSLNAFFQNVAQSGPRGFYPKYWFNEQTYWTPIGVPKGTTRAIINEEGLLEVDEGTFSLEPFVYLDGKLITWADTSPVQQLEQGCLPIPSSLWRMEGLTLSTTAYASDSTGKAVLYVRYRLENTSAHPLQPSFFAAIRPFQVTPPWQAYKNLGGASPTKTLAYHDHAVWVNDSRAVIPLSQPNRCGVVAFEQGAITEYLKTGVLPPQSQISDNFGYASGALSYDLELAPGVVRDIYLAIPFGSTDAAQVAQIKTTCGAEQFAQAVQDWQKLLAVLDIHLPPAAQVGFAACKTAAAHILINRDGPAIQPGPRRYTRSWIRDAALMAAALLRLSCNRAAQDFVRWYAPYMDSKGFVPCCVDSSGPDWLAEYDSQGEFVFAVMECFRFVGDSAFLREMWPAVLKAIDFMEGLRKQRLTAEYQKSACYGLLPESVSHEGYLAHPVHAYWDDFWALRGLKDAVNMAQVLDDQPQATRLAALRDDFRLTLAASIATTMAIRNIDFLPGSVEWADFDPTATANAIALLYDELPQLLPPAAVERTFAKYLSNFRLRCRDEIPWINYSAYEVRIIGALVRLGQRQGALELLEFLLSDRRPLAWNQWPEITWRDVKTPGHMGDLPHSWIGAEYMLSFLSLFAFEQEVEQALVIAAGINAAWLADGFEICVKNLPTYYGKLSYTLRQDGANSLCLNLSGEFTPSLRSIMVKPPLPRPLMQVEANGSPIGSFDQDSATLDVRLFPVTLVMTY